MPQGVHHAGRGVTHEPLLRRGRGLQARGQRAVLRAGREEGHSIEACEGRCAGGAAVGVDGGGDAEAEVDRLGLPTYLGS